MSNVSIIIPARWGSSRFPGKPLAKINGKEMILHTVSGCVPAFGKKAVFVVTDDERISDVVTSAGYQVIMTPKDLKFETGTDRVAYASKKLDSYFVINVQGDEPLIDYNDILSVYNSLKVYPEYVINCCSSIDDGDVENTNTVKVIRKPQGEFMYMSRSVIPHKKTDYHHKRQVCIYGYNTTNLYSVFGEGRNRSSLESSEDIELLRFINDCYGTKIKILYLNNSYQAVDVPEDIEKVERILNERKSN